MRVLGVDPGLTRCGVGVVEQAGSRSRLRLVEVGVLTTAPTTPIAERLRLLDIMIADWLDRLRPDAVAVERVFSQHNVRTVMGTAQAGAVALLAAAQRGLPVALHTPSEVKAAVTGSGTADKVQVNRMVSRLLDLPSVPGPPDAADALALAICHLWRSPMQAPAARAAPSARPAGVRPPAVPTGPGAAPARGLLAAAQGLAP